MNAEARARRFKVRIDNIATGRRLLEFARATVPQHMQPPPGGVSGVMIHDDNGTTIRIEVEAI
jgi:hypothetical protein